MDMRLDEAWHQKGTVRVDGAVSAFGVGNEADRDNAPVTHQQVAFDDLEGVVHGDDGGAADNQPIHARLPRVGSG